MNLASLRALPLLCLACLPTALQANHLVQKPFADNAAAAELVVIGTAIEPPPGTLSGFSSVRVDTVLKGTAPGADLVLADGFIAEFDPECCVPGQTYLMLLRRNGYGHWQSVNGRHAVIRTSK